MDFWRCSDDFRTLPKIFRPFPYIVGDFRRLSKNVRDGARVSKHNFNYGSNASFTIWSFVSCRNSIDFTRLVWLLLSELGDIYSLAMCTHGGGGTPLPHKLRGQVPETSVLFDGQISVTRWKNKQIEDQMWLPAARLSSRDLSPLHNLVTSTCNQPSMWTLQGTGRWDPLGWGTPYKRGGSAERNILFRLGYIKGYGFHKSWSIPKGWENCHLGIKRDFQNISNRRCT